MNRRLLLVCIGACVAGVTFAHAGPPQAPRAVVELFTSQSCSSCPPADKLMAEIASDPSVVAVSMPVDYWDYLGWKDTLADHAFTARQKAYGEQRGDRQVYTPQAVICGATHAVGSNRDAIQDARKAAIEKGTMTVPLSLDLSGGTLRVSVPAGTGPANLFVLPIRKRSDVAITRGENKGKNVSYVNVARAVLPIGEWTGAPQTFEAPVSLTRLRDADSFVVLLQAGTLDKPGIILGAAKGPGL